MEEVVRLSCELWLSADLTVHTDISTLIATFNAALRSYNDKRASLRLPGAIDLPAVTGHAWPTILQRAFDREKSPSLPRQTRAVYFSALPMLVSHVHSDLKFVHQILVDMNVLTILSGIIARHKAAGALEEVEYLPTQVWTTLIFGGLYRADRGPIHMVDSKIIPSTAYWLTELSEEMRDRVTRLERKNPREFLCF